MGNRFTSVPNNLCNLLRAGGRKAYRSLVIAFFGSNRLHLVTEGFPLRPIFL